MRNVTRDVEETDHPEGPSPDEHVHHGSGDGHDPQPDSTASRTEQSMLEDEAEAADENDLTTGDTCEWVTEYTTN